MKLLPLNDKILVKAIEKDEVVKGGIIIPESAKEKPQEAVIVSVGPGKMLESGKRIPPIFVEGDKVMFSKYSGSEFEIEGVKYMILDECDVLALVRE
jgi:chaperonin GroES